MPSFNPQAWQNYDLKNENQARDFLRQLSNWCIQMQMMSTIAGLLNTQGLLNVTALSNTSAAVSVTSGSSSLSCANATSVVARYSLGSGTPSTWTLTLSNVPVGVLVIVKVFNLSGGAVTVKISATDKNGTSVTPFAILSGGLATNMSTTGRSLANNTNQMYVGGLAALADELDLLAF